MILKRTYAWIRDLHGKEGVKVKAICPICQSQVEFKIPSDFVDRGEEYSVACVGDHPEGENFRISAAVSAGKGRLADRTQVFTELYPAS